MTHPTRDRGPGSARRAFTLIELLVVISIFILLLLIAVPAFSSMLYSSEESLAENSMRSGLTAARDAAARGRQGQDGAAVFLYDAAAQKTSIIPCVQVGVLMDLDLAGNEVRRDIFAPVPGFESTSLPRGWTIRGYALANSIDDDWYGDPGITANPYSSTGIRQQGNWIFPETDFYDWEDEADGADRQTFIVRFEGGTGALKPGDLDPVLILSPAPTDFFRNSAPFSNYRADLAADKAKFVRTVLSTPLGTLPIADRRALLGDECVDTILAKPVAQLALCNEKKLAAGLTAGSGTAIRVDNATGCLYRSAVAANYEPQMVTNVDLDDLTLYMEGRLQSPGGVDGEFLPSESRVFSVNRYLGSLIEVTGSINGQGVSQ